MNLLRFNSQTYYGKIKNISCFVPNELKPKREKCEIYYKCEAWFEKDVFLNLDICEDMSVSMSMKGSQSENIKFV